jgi:hypothetical protein
MSSPYPNAPIDPGSDRTPDPAGTHNLDNTVVAVLDDSPAVRDAIEGLTEAGFDFEILRGEPGRQHLDPTGEGGGVIATLKRLMNVFGDQYRILERLDEELAKGRTVVSVEVEPDDASQAIAILRDHGGEYLWKLGTWTFTPVGD